MNKFFWNFYSRVYDSIGCLLPYQELLARTESVISADVGSSACSVLDVGCGTGNFLKKIKHLFSNTLQYIGVDFSGDMLARAKHKNKEIQQASFVLHDFNHGEKFDKSSFSHLVSLNSLYTMNSPKKSVKEFNRLLKLGGTLIIANPKENPSITAVLWSHACMLREIGLRRAVLHLLTTMHMIPVLFITIILNIVVIKKLGKDKKYHFLSREELCSLIENSGFNISEVSYAYGESDIFIVARKVLVVCEENDIHVRLVSTKNEFDEMCRLRYTVYCREIKSLDPESYTSGYETDQYDDYSVHFVLVKRGVIIGTLRLVKNSKEGFLIEDAVALPPDLQREKTLEPSRLIVTCDERGQNNADFLDDAAEIWSRENGYLTWCIAINEKLVERRIKRGWSMQKLGEAIDYHNTRVIPVLRTL